MTFEQCLEEVLKHEGGYSNNPKDPGGETMMGITKTTAKMNGYYGPMKDIPYNVVKTIYFKDYWQKAKCDLLPASIRLIHFDSAVNSGVSRAAKWLQTSLESVQVDGIIGPKTLEATKKANPRWLINRYASLRMSFLKSLKTFPVFGRGWTRRVDSVTKRSLEE